MKNSETVQLIHLFWTGGWDSIFRLLSLISHYACCIQPYYVIDRERPSWSVEIETMRKIRETCCYNPSRFIGTIRQPILVEKEAIPTDEQITTGYKQLRSRVYVGAQYEWLARLAKSMCIDAFELGVHEGDRLISIICQYIEPKHGPFTRTHVLRLDAPEELHFLRYYEFPIIDVPKVEMERIAKERGFYPILEMSWFCFEPLKELRPCGTCNPCKYAIEGGMARRIGWRGLIRYYAKMIDPIAQFAPWPARASIKRLLGIAPLP